MTEKEIIPENKEQMELKEMIKEQMQVMEASLKKTVETRINEIIPEIMNMNKALESEKVEEPKPLSESEFLVQEMNKFM